MNWLILVHIGNFELRCFGVADFVFVRFVSFIRDVIDAANNIPEALAELEEVTPIITGDLEEYDGQFFKIKRCEN